MSFRLGVDVGGTFTDLVLFDPDTNALEFAKTSSTPANQAAGVEEGIVKVARQRGIEPSAIAFLARPSGSDSEISHSERTLQSRLV